MVAVAVVVVVGGRRGRGGAGGGEEQGLVGRIYMWVGAALGPAGAENRINTNKHSEKHPNR